MARNKVKLTICGTDYNILSDDNEQYIIEVGNQVDKRMTEILQCNSRLSTTMAAILVALEYCDIAKKYERTIEAMKNKENKELAKKAVDENQDKKFELQVERLKEEVERLENKISSISKENVDMIQSLSDQELEIKSLLQKKDDQCSSYNNKVENDGEDVLNFFDFQRISEGI